MKILALRVRNLTSLAGEAVLDFEAPPLAQAGLFAITGPTGAGKSTLLDALCLALYDRLPRLAGHGDDVRTVLRHGAADGHAEVDFLGRDGGRYRARWEVRRARNRADGTLQAQKMALTDLATGASLGGGKRETLDAIADKVGLDYHQFRRSVLLAQNDFDAFLRAKPDDRAGLLELMTGTAIYGELSKAAYERSKAEDATLKALDEELRRVNVLADDERAAILAETAAAEEQSARLAEEVEGLAREIDWYRIAAELAVASAEAEAQATIATQAVADAQPERDRMDHVRQALALAPQIAEQDRLTGECRRLETETQAATTTLADTETAQTQAGEHRDRAAKAEQEAEAAFKAAGPLLDRAAELDTRLAEGRERLTRCAAILAEAQALAVQAERNAVEARQQRQECIATAAELERWLAEHGGHRLIAEGLDRWLDAIGAHARAAAERDRAADRYGAARRLLAELNAQAAADTLAAQALNEQLAGLDNRIAALSAQADGVDADALESRRDGLAALADALAARQDAAAALDAVQKRQAELADRQQAAQTRQTQAQAERDAAGEALNRVRAALPEAQAALRLAEAAEGEQAQVLRSRLIAGEPCPVCGAREHATDQVHSALTGLLAELRRRAADLENERDILMRRQAEADAQGHAAAAILAQAEIDAAALEGERQQLSVRLAQAETAAETLARQWQVALADTDRAAIETERQTLGETLRTARAAETERRRLLLEGEHLRRQIGEVVARQGVLAGERAGQEAELRAAREDGERAAALMAEQADKLAPPLAALSDGCPTLREADALAACLRAVAEEWRRKSAAQERVREDERTLAGKAEAAAAALDNARRNLETETRRRDDEQAALDRLVSARTELFDGRPTADVRTDLNNAFTAAREAHQHAQAHWAAAAQAHSAAASRLSLLAEAHRAATEAAAEAGRDLASRLAEIGLTQADVRAAMALGPAWMSEAEARQAALRETEAAARAVQSERRRAEAAHAAAGRPERPAAELAGLLTVRTGERDATRDALARLRQRLADDDRNRDAAEDTRRRIASQRQQADLWKGMADLIGSADGKKFRLFAQGLTLDRLLGLANRHLAELTPRYVLRRAPGADLDLLVIDRDMADEVRAVANLSGGERFLVSLALALGLASMSGHRILAESLFIDEGFGALDAESLDVAIGALETLHASGRKVGVISHVQPMIERIGVQVRVSRLGGGRSAVEVLASGGSV